jgi:hypothetical protein
MVQQGQVFKLRTKSADGKAVWAYRYRFEGRGSVRPQVGGFASRAEAQRALSKVLGRLGPGGRAATLTLGELVDELPGYASGRGGHDREAALAAREGDCRARRGTAGGALAGAGVRVAAHRAGGASLRGDPGASAGPQPCGRLGVDRL